MFNVLKITLGMCLKVASSREHQGAGGCSSSGQSLFNIWCQSAVGRDLKYWLDSRFDSLLFVMWFLPYTSQDRLSLAFPILPLPGTEWLIYNYFTSKRLVVGADILPLFWCRVLKTWNLWCNSLKTHWIALKNILLIKPYTGPTKTSLRSCPIVYLN